MLGILSFFVGITQPMASALCRAFCPCLLASLSLWRVLYAGHFVLVCWQCSAYGECFMLGILSLFVGNVQPMVSAFCWAFRPCLLASLRLWGVLHAGHFVLVGIAQPKP